MSQEQFTPAATLPAPCAGRWSGVGGHAASDFGNPSAQDRAFIALQNAYRPHRCLMRLHPPAVGDRVRPETPEREVLRLVDAGELFGFPWHDALWLPLFQFDLQGPTVAAGPQRVVAELGPGFDGWALAGWFVQPHASLACHSPVECLASRLPQVLAAARADRVALTA